jgi:circadian clock protein KaiC
MLLQQWRRSRLMEGMAEFKPQWPVTGQWLDTGVPNLDLVLGGGLEEHNSYIIAGPPGTGKSVLIQQIAFHRARLGERVLFVTGLDEPHHNLLEHLRSFRFGDLSLVGPQIETVSLVPFLDQPVPEKINVLRRTVLNVRPRLVTLDGLRSLEAFTDGEEGMYRFLHGLTSWFAVEGITLVATRDSGPDVDAECPEFSLVDGVWLLQHEFVRGRPRRRLWIKKMRGQKALDGPHAFTIDEDGMTVWPRPQDTFHLEDRPWREERMALGVPALDSMLAGGLPEATATLLAGDAGAGETILGLSFLREGVQQGQSGLWLGFRESPPELLAMGRLWGGDLAEAQARGQVRFLTVAPFDVEPERLANQLQGTAVEMGARRLVLHGAELLVHAFPSRHEARDFVAWLVRALSQQGVTLLITQQAPTVAGRAFDVSGEPLASLADNVIVARQAQRGSQLRRALAVTRMSRPGYEATIREYVVDQYGITVGEPLRSESEVEEPAPRASGEPVRGPI